MSYIRQNSSGGGTIVPNTSHLHKLTSPTRLPQAKKANVLKPHNDGVDDIAVDRAIVSNFLKTVVGETNGTTPVKNSSHLFRSQVTMNFDKEPEHQGLKKARSNYDTTAAVKEDIIGRPKSDGIAQCKPTPVKVPERPPWMKSVHKVGDTRWYEPTVNEIEESKWKSAANNGVEAKWKPTGVVDSQSKVSGASNGLEAKWKPAGAVDTQGKVTNGVEARWKPTVTGDTQGKVTNGVELRRKPTGTGDNPGKVTAVTTSVESRWKPTGAGDNQGKVTGISNGTETKWKTIECQPKVTATNESLDNKWRSSGEEVEHRWRSPLKGSDSPKTPVLSNADEIKWKNKFDESEKRRKELLAESQRVMREKTNLEKQVEKLTGDYKSLNDVCTDRTQQLDKLRRVSEQVYQDYDQLNMKYETETSALHQALEVASKWYKENKKLKRESVALRSAVGIQGLDDTVDGEPEQEEQPDEMAELRKTVQNLSNQVAQLQAELNRARLQEFEAQEQFINMTQALDEQRKEKEKLMVELRELRVLKEKFQSVSFLVQDEMQTLRREKDRATETASRLQAEAHQAQKERNVLAHQSTLLMGDMSSDERMMKLILEIEDLKRQLEEETQNHGVQVQRLEQLLEDRQSEAQLELLEEKLKLAESELQLALQRAEAAEQSQSALNSKISELESQRSDSACNGGAPPPPPPPPPLPPPMPFRDISTTQKPLKIVKKAGADSLEDMANLLGIQRQAKAANNAPGAIDDIINEIKGGKFTLKATEKQKTVTKKEETTPAMQEMLSIIGTLKRRPRPPADVHL